MLQKLHTGVGSYYRNYIWNDRIRDEKSFHGFNPLAQLCRYCIYIFIYWPRNLRLHPQFSTVNAFREL